MRLLALPENVYNDVLETLQELPFRKIFKLITEVQQAKVVIDAQTREPVLVPDPRAPAEPASTPVDVTPAQ